MHPHLGLHAHPMCVEQIKALQACHAANPWRKFLGVCNEPRRLMDVCLGEEFEEQRLANRKKGKLRDV